MKSKLLPAQDDLRGTLRNCREGVGVGLVPTARAGRFVPAPFQLDLRLYNCTHTRSFSLTRYVDLAIHNGPRGMTLSLGEERPC